MSYKLPENIKCEKELDTVRQIKENGYQKIEGNYQGKNSPLVVYCPKHDVILETTYTNYKRSRTGLPCCGKEQVRAILLGRVFRPEAIEKMEKAALNRPDRGGSEARYWRKTNSYIQWRKEVFRRWNSKCAITGLQNPEADLIAHHFFNASREDKFACNPKNGIVITKELHVLYHSQFGYNSNTLVQFQTFLVFILHQDKPTSSQGDNFTSLHFDEELSQGSETRVFDSQRIEKLHEFLGELGNKLVTELFE